jgi:prepilin-type N-terminal cleavage/methylation domain-containing protein
MQKSKSFVQHHFLNKSSSGSSNITSKRKGGAGFTIIELLVVVAIIAVLTGIVLVNVTQYTGKGKNSSIKGNLNSIFTGGVQYFENNGNYANFCDSSYVTAPKSAIGNIIDVIDPAYWKCEVNTDNTSWCICAMEVPTDPSGGIALCIDSTGAKKEGFSSHCFYVCYQNNPCQ